MDILIKTNNEYFDKNKIALDEIKSTFPNHIRRVGEPLGDPILCPYIYPFVFLADRDPTGTEPDIYNGYAGLILIWENETSGDFFIGPDNTASPLPWNKIATDANLLSILNNLGWNINTARTYSASGISLNTARQPSLTSDTFVVASINQNNTLLTTTACTAQISIDNLTWITVGSAGDTTGVASNTISTISFPVPIGYYYRIEWSGSGTVTLSSCNELSQ